MSFDYERKLVTDTATIANGESLSGAIDTNGVNLVSIVMPASWDAANLTFQGSVDGSTYNNVYTDGGTEYTVTAAASRLILIDFEKLQGARYLKIRSGTAGVAVNQTAQRTLTVGLRKP